MSENPLLERARRFLSALRHCQVLGLTVEAADEKGLTLRLPYSQRSSATRKAGSSTAARSPP